MVTTKVTQAQNRKAGIDRHANDDELSRQQTREISFYGAETTILSEMTRFRIIVKAKL
jgi:hypothetical protein